MTFFSNKLINSSLFYSNSRYNSNNTLTISSPFKMSFRFANCNINRTSLMPINQFLCYLEGKKIQNLELNTQFWQTIEVNSAFNFYTDYRGVFSRDEFELEFSGSSKPELWRFRAELGHFNFWAETELKFFKH